MPRRQAEYNPSYIQISSRDHRQPRGGEAEELVTVTSGRNRVEHRRDSHLITLKMFYPSAFSSLSLEIRDNDIFFVDGLESIISLFL